MSVEHDIKALKAANKALRESNEHLEDAIESISDAFVLYDVGGKLVLCNQEHRDFYPHVADLYQKGTSREEILRSHAAALQKKDPSFDLDAYLEQRLALINLPRSDMESQLADGRWVAIRERSVVGGGVVSIRTDITDRRLAEQTIKFMASHDELTNLPKRNTFLDRVEQGLARARRGKTIAALLFVDLDGFKQVNDTFGHIAGDETLKQVANRLATRFRETDTVGRIGGDEFTVILTDISDKSVVSNLAEKILDAISEPFHVEDNEVTIGASVGIAIYPDHGQNPDDLLKAADDAMYAAKKMGKGTYHFSST